MGTIKYKHYNCFCFTRSYLNLYCPNVVVVQFLLSNKTYFGLTISMYIFTVPENPRCSQGYRTLASSYHVIVASP